MFPKTSKKLRNGSGVRVNGLGYASTIADALRIELGSSHAAHKTLMKWTGANERTAQNWLSGTNGPSGVHLIPLMIHSDGVFEGILRLTGRRAVICEEKLTEVCNSLQLTAELLSEAIEENKRRLRNQTDAPPGAKSSSIG